MKKIVKVVGLLLLLCIGVLVAIPFFLESKIEAIVQNYADENLDADLKFDAITLSLISSFPKASINVDNILIVNRAPFEGEPLASAKALAFEMPMTELLNGIEKPIAVTEIIADELLLTLKTNSKGLTNYDILRSTTTEIKPSETKSSGKGFSFDIKHYELNNSAFNYIDESSHTALHITELNHLGNGVFSGSSTTLDTHTDAKITMEMDSTSYMQNTKLQLDAVLDLDLEKSKYTFKDNKAFINALPLEFNGFVQLLDSGQLFDLSFKNPQATFKDFLAVLPEAYSKNVNDVSTTGGFTVKGVVNGMLTETTIPKLDINLVSKNASFKYPDLPKSVQNIMINASVKNLTGRLEDTYIDLNQLDFKIDEDVFKSEAHIKQLTSNVLVDANLEGVLNLSNLAKAYPIVLDNELKGLLKGKINTHFDLNAIQTNAYQRIKNNGKLEVSDVVFSSEDIVNPIQINTAIVDFKPGLITLQSLSAQTGKSDFTASGTINKLLGFLLSDKKLQGDFKAQSNVFAVSDFMVEDHAATTTSNKTTTAAESLKIPDFLDCTIAATAKKVHYDNLTLANVKGQLVIKNQAAKLTNMTTEVFNGKLGLSGLVDTKGAVPSFDMQLAMQEFDISQSFKDLDLLKALAPIAKVLEGKLNSTINLSGLLNTDFAPDLATISGKALAEILTTKINDNESAIIAGLTNKLKFIDFKALEKDIKTRLHFENGQVTVKPFTVSYKDIPVEISGRHSFTNTMNYSAVFNVPAKYLGSDINRLIGQINDTEVNNISVPVTATIGGTFTSPSVTTDLSNSVSNLTQQLVDIQKQKLIGKGKDKVNDLLGGVLGEATKTQPTDTMKTKGVKSEDLVKEGVNSVLGGIFGKKKKKKNDK